MDKPLDCLVIGGGPAGLTAAIYLSRYHLDIMVVDSGKSRAALIPCTPGVQATLVRPPIQTVPSGAR